MFIAKAVYVTTCKTCGLSYNKKNSLCRLFFAFKGIVYIKPKHFNQVKKVGTAHMPILTAKTTQTHKAYLPSQTSAGEEAFCAKERAGVPFANGIFKTKWERIAPPHNTMGKAETIGSRL